MLPSGHSHPPPPLPPPSRPSPLPCPLPFPHPNGLPWPGWAEPCREARASRSLAAGGVEGVCAAVGHFSGHTRTWSALMQCRSPARSKASGESKLYSPSARMGLGAGVRGMWGGRRRGMRSAMRAFLARPPPGHAPGPAPGPAPGSPQALPPLGPLWAPLAPPGWLAPPPAQAPPPALRLPPPLPRCRRR
jgi:hypothetical protein